VQHAAVNVTSITRGTKKQSLIPVLER